MTKYLERYKAVQKKIQSLCPHMAGGWGILPSDRTCIIWHKLDAGGTVGICLEWGRQFWPHDPDYSKWKQKPHLSLPSGAGENRGEDLSKLLDEVSFSRVLELWKNSKLKIADTDPDPWLLNKDGSQDEFALVDFSGDHLDTFWYLLQEEANARATK